MTIRKNILDEACSIVNGARADTYGGPEDSFNNIGGLWESYLCGRLCNNITNTDVACMMILMKVARLKQSPDHRDSWVDIAGYAACGAECARVDHKKLSEPPSPTVFHTPTSVGGVPISKELYDNYWETVPGSSEDSFEFLDQWSKKQAHDQAWKDLL